MEGISVTAICISAIATGVIAWSSIVNHRLTKAIKETQDESSDRDRAREEEFRQRVEDLYQGIMVSVFIASMGATSAFSTMEQKIKEFKEYYKGKTTIF